MIRIFRALMQFIIVSLCLLVFGIFLAYYFASRSLPDYEHAFTSDRISSEVEIVRNSANIPHIFAEEDRDVYFGLGYAHAQDRLWQMTMLRRSAQGRLSEIFGPSTFGADDYVRRLDIYEIARQSLAFQSAETRQALNAYSDGVNAYLKDVVDNARGRGAPEFFAFGAQIDAWSPSDSLAILKVLNLQMSDHLRNEITRARASLAVGPKRIKDLMPDSPATGEQSLPSLPEFSELFQNLPQIADLGLDHLHPLHPIQPLGLGGASNAWAALGTRTDTGKPILANDPHLGLSAPSIWMLARLGFKDGSVIGGSIPGIPLIFMGRNPNLAWGLTTAYLDDTDLYVEKLNPDDGGQYLTENGFKDFVTRESLIQIKDEPTRTISMSWTDNGPVLPSDLLQLNRITPPGHVMSMRSTVLRSDDLTLTSAMRLMRSKSISDARYAARDFVAPAQMLTLADSDSVASLLIGAQPKRAANHASQGRIPSQGWLKQNQWQGTLAFDKNPFVQDPKSGIVATTNNKITDAAFPEHVSFYWGDTQRIKRLEKLMNGREIHTRESFIEAQLDTVSFSAQSLLALIGRELWFTGEPAVPGTIEAQRQKALEMLASWNGEMSEHLGEPLIYTAWMRQLQERLIKDDLGKIANLFTHPDPIFLERVYRDIEGASAWCDIRQSSAIEDCQTIAVQSLDSALIELSQTYGDRLTSWRWGEAHQAKHDHDVLGRVPLVNWITNIRQDTSGGDNTLMRGMTAGVGPMPYANIHAAGYRAVIDMADPESSLFVISTGQSGHFLSRFYDDMAQLWRRGEYISMSLNEELARAGAIGTTLISPSE